MSSITVVPDVTLLPEIEKQLPAGVPIVMVNLVSFKSQADYGVDSEETPCSGFEAYTTRYIPAFGEVVKKLGADSGKVLYMGACHVGIVAPVDEKWDMVVIVEYPSFAGFRIVAESKEYQELASHHRLAALANWRLIATTKMGI